MKGNILRPLRMRLRLRLRLAVLGATSVAALLLGLALAPAASPKEAYSALVDSTTTGVTRAFPAGDAALTVLGQYIPATHPAGTSSPPRLEKGVRPDTSGQITVLWHMAGMPTLTSYAIMPNYAGPGEAWIRSVRYGGNDRPQMLIRWQPAPDALMSYLEQIGVYDASSDSRSQSALSATTAAHNSESWQAGWWWVGPGILAGAFIALSLRPTTLGLIPGRADRPRAVSTRPGTERQSVS